MKTIRTIRGVVRELQTLDSNCAITENCIRQLCRAQVIPFHRSGNRYLIALEDVLSYFDCDMRTNNM